MKCSELQLNLSLYADGLLDDGQTSAAAEHLEVCPLCRECLSEIREMRAALKQMMRPGISAAMQNSIKAAVRSEIRSRKLSWLPISSDVREWLQMRVMPYGVGVLASVIIGFTLLTMMFSGMLRSGPFVAATNTAGPTDLLAANTHVRPDPDSSDISQSDFARTRLGFANESPSVNPQGALIALTKALVRGGMKDDEVVVVADVFGNGLAQIAEVVEPSRDRRAVGELEKALDSDPAFAPFVPANMENRPDSVRVILKFQSVNVSTGSRREKRRH